MQQVKELRYYEDGKRRPYLHLVDGGVSDNLGMRAILQILEEVEALRLEGVPTPLDHARRLALFVVNSLSTPPLDWDAKQSAPGTLEAHYAPAAPVRLMNAMSLQTALDLLGADAAHIAVYSRVILKTPSAGVIQRRMPDDAAATAQQLFAVLREFDAQGARLIWVETPPDTPEWEGVRDRLQRAAAA